MRSREIAADPRYVWHSASFVSKSAPLTIQRKVEHDAERHRYTTPPDVTCERHRYTPSDVTYERHHDSLPDVT